MAAAPGIEVAEIFWMVGQREKTWIWSELKVIVDICSVVLFWGKMLASVIWDLFTQMGMYARYLLQFKNAHKTL